ncbi:Fic family protein [Nocardioides aestuarii]|uniref:Fic family protein n=1 Tax=Nocardioides aestuarii TaxID=252231 RepID=A0ABW4TM14_9ACTN
MFGTPPARVRGEVTAAFAELDRRLDALDARIANGESVEDVYEDVLAVCAWIHGQWVRIHPFVDHNGSTARLLTVAVGLRYGIPLQLPGKPRSQLPTDGLVVDYNLAAGNQMSGDDHLMKLFLHDLVEETLRQATTATAAEGSAIPVEGRFDSAADASAE